MQLKDFLFPKICLSCGLLGSYVCLKCEKTLAYMKKDICLYCGRASLMGFTHPICQRPKGVDGLISIYYYNNTLKKIIKNIKYRLVSDAFEELFRIINYEVLADKLKYFRNLKGSILICPIPLHVKRLNQRGFNQSIIIANFYARLLNLPVISVLERNKDTQSQAKLKKDIERHMNMRGVFSLKKGSAIKGKNIILVDDLVTSGSTVKEAAIPLKRHGAASVYVLTLAKG